ncbi:MAG: hypothetical protein KGD57_10635 [Candidatus Lokiarchaeota archaeon]|nr:hypothetical protein [Candidatus Lokiarchaeota archaeon]
MNKNQPIIIDGECYENIDQFKEKRKNLIKVGKDRYWAIPKTSILISNREVFEKVIAWVNERINAYENSNKTVFDEKGKGSASLTKEFCKEIAISSSTVLGWCEQYIIAVKGLEEGTELYKNIFSRKSIPWQSYNFLKGLVKTVSTSKIGQPARLKTSYNEFQEIIRRCNFKDSKIRSMKIKIECPFHGEFETRYENLFYGRWCRRCTWDTYCLSYDDVKQRGLDYGYILKDDEPTFKKKCFEQGTKPTITVLKWECFEGHSTEKYLKSMRRYGCIDCYRLSKMTTYERFLNLIHKAGFKTKLNKQEFIQIKKKCINKNLILTHHIYFDICCSEGHKFSALLHSIKIGLKCPYCGMTALQKRIHLYMEAALRVPFESEVDVRRIIPNETSYLKVDGYGEIYIGNRLVKIIFEAMGRQHRFFVEKYHKSQKDLERQKRRDQYLRDICKDEGIVLIEFWYNDVVTTYKDLLINQFYKQTKELGIFNNGYNLQNIPQFTSRVLHNKFLRASQPINQRQIKDFFCC